jgi:hypothetical protein
MLEGGCFCGAIRYRIAEGDYPSVNCHCSMCRRIHAAPFVTWLVVPAANFAYTSDRLPAEFQSSESGTRFRCPDCGTQLACVNSAHPEVVDVAVGSLDAPERHRPRLDVFDDTRLSWIEPVASRSRN